MSQNDYSLKPLKFKCSYCGGKLSVIMERNDNPLEREYYPDGIECDECDAAWDLAGQPTRGTT